MASMRVFFFGDGKADGGSECKDLVGGKGASLGDMTRAGLNVPPGFTISSECCRLFHQSQSWPDGLLDEIRAAIERLERLAGRRLGAGETPLLVAVRSGAAQSMPGMMDTILNVGLTTECVESMARRAASPDAPWEAYFHFLCMYARTVHGSADPTLDADIDRFVGHASPAMSAETRHAQRCRALRDFLKDRGIDVPAAPFEQVAQSVLAVFRSWNSERAVAYRRHHRIDSLLGTAVNVQMMCPSEVSGVLFTANPVTAAADEIILESSFGLGEAVVLGKVTPDRFVLDKRTLAIRERRISRKDFILAAAEGHAPRGAPSLSDHQIVELARIALRVEGHFGVACDIEWGLAGGRFYLLQARPIRFSSALITAEDLEKVRQEEIAALRALAEPSGTVWARFNLSEILPEPTPMTWAIVRRFMSGQGGFGLMYRDLGFDPDPGLDEAGVFDLVCGRPYCNLSREPRMQFCRLPLEHSFAELKANPGKALYPRAAPNFRRAGWTFWLTLPLTLCRMAWAQWRLKRSRSGFATKFTSQIVPRFLDEVRRAEAEDISALPPQVLLQRLEHWIDRTLVDFARQSLKPTALAGVVLAGLEQTLSRRLRPFARDPKDEQANTALGLQRAGVYIRELVMGVVPDREADLAGAMRRLADGSLELDAFLADFGHRCSMEMELMQPRWSESSDELRRRVPRSAAAMEAPSDRPASGAPGATRHVWDRLSMEARLMPFQIQLLEDEVAELHQFLRLRESAKHHLLRGYALIRRFLVELGGRFGLGDDVFFLTPEELPRLAATAPGEAGGLAPWRELAGRRRERRRIALSLPVPQVIFSDDLEAIGRAVSADASATFQGVPLSAGVAEGAAWVLREAGESAPPAADYILVCPSTDPAWMPLFVNARGLVMETGGVLSHGAIVAREFGLPAVAGIADVHHRLKTGQRLRVDGGTGNVQIVG